MTLACWCTTSQLHSPTHFHTWLTLSPSNWVASLQNTLKALFHGEFGVTDYSRAAGVTPRQNRHSVGGSLCMFKYFDVKHEGLVGQFFLQLLQGWTFWCHSSFFFSFGCGLIEDHQRSSNYFFDLYQPFANLSLTAAVPCLPWAPVPVAVTQNSSSFCDFLLNKRQQRWVISFVLNLYRL